jgi:hypothetical protein
VQETVAAPLNSWESFYVIIGSSGAALTGLMFVVIALIAESRQRSSEGVAAYGTPNIVHFCAALLVSANLSAPWRALIGAGLTLAVSGIAGLVYVFIVARRQRRMTSYTPGFEDWLFHTFLPVVAYATYLVAGLLLPYWPTSSLFAVGAVTLMLLFVGIHNAWDTVTFITLDDPSRANNSSGESPHASEEPPLAAVASSGASVSRNGPG